MTEPGAGSSDAMSRESARLEKRLESLDYDGVGANFGIIMMLDPPPARAYRLILRDLDRGLARAPSSARLHALKGKALSNLSRHAEARRAFARSLELDGLSARTRAWFGADYLLESRVDDAFRELDAALALDPDCAWASFYRSAARYIMGDAAAAGEDLRVVLKVGEGPPALAARAFLGLLEAKAGRFDAALARMNEVVKRSRGEAWPYVLRAAVQRLSGRPAAGLKDLNVAVAARPVGWVHSERALLLEELGRRREAVRDLGVALRMDGPRRELFLRRGRLEAARGRHAAAAADFQRALALGANADVRGFGLELALALNVAGCGEASLKVLSALAAEFPLDGEVGFILAQALGPSAAFAKAAAVLRRELSGNMRDARLWLLLARAEAGRKNLAAAEDAARRAAALAPDSEEAGGLVAGLALQRDLLKPGAALPDKFPMGADNFDGWLLLATLLLERGLVEEMRKTLRRARERAKTHADGGVKDLRGRFWLAVAAGDFVEAAGWGEKILDATRDADAMAWLNWPFMFKEPMLAAVPAEYRKELLDALDRCVREAPESPWGYFYRGVLDGDAHSDIERIAGFDPKRYGWMRFRLAKRLVLIDGNYTRALPEFRLAARFSKPGHWLSECGVGEALLCRGDRAGALAAFRAAERMVPKEQRPEFLTWKGALLLWIGRYRPALAALNQGIAGGAVRRLGFCWKGGALMLLGRYDEAIEALDRGLGFLPGDVEARIYRAETLYRKRRYAAALRDTEKAVRAGGGGAGFYIDVIAALAHRGKGDLAKMRGAYLRLPPEVVAFVRTKLGVAGEDDAAVFNVLEGILTLSRGVRRGSYETGIWLR